MAAIPLGLDEEEASPGEDLGADADDAIVEECIADALGPWLGILSTEQIAEHRRFLTAFILTHPAARPLYDGVRYARLRGQSNAQSGDVAKDGVLVAPEADGLGSDTGTGGGRR